MQQKEKEAGETKEIYRKNEYFAPRKEAKHSKKGVKNEKNRKIFYFSLYDAA